MNCSTGLGTVIPPSTHRCDGCQRVTAEFLHPCSEPPMTVRNPFLEDYVYDGGNQPIQQSTSTRPEVPIGREGYERDRKPALMICCCEFPVKKICVSCRDEHSLEPSRYPHLQLPLAAVPYLQADNALGQMRRRITQKQLADEKLQEVFQAIDSAEESIMAEYEALHEEIELAKGRQQQNLEQMRQVLRTAIAEAMQEVDEHIYDSDYNPTTSLASKIFRYEESNSEALLNIDVQKAKQAVLQMVNLRLNATRMRNEVRNYAAYGTCDQCRSVKQTLYKVPCLYCERCLFSLQRKCSNFISTEEIRIPESNLSSGVPNPSSVPPRPQKLVPREEQKTDQSPGEVPQLIQELNFFPGLLQEERKSALSNITRETIDESQVEENKAEAGLPSSPVLSGKNLFGKQCLQLLMDKAEYKKRVENGEIKGQKQVCELFGLPVIESCSWAWLSEERIVVCVNTGTYIVTLSNGLLQDIKLIERRKLPGIGVSPDSQIYFFGGTCDRKVLSSWTSFKVKEEKEANLSRAMIEPRFGFHPVYHDNHFYIVGGTLSKCYEMFSIENSSCSAKPTGDQISERAVAVVKDDRLLIIQSGKTQYIDLRSSSMWPELNQYQEVKTPTAPVLCGNKVFILDKDGGLCEVAVS